MTRFTGITVALVLAGCIGPGAGNATAQAILEVGGAGVIGDSALSTTNGTAEVPVGGANWTVAGGAGFVYSGLVSPPATVTTNGSVTLTFDHRYFIESGWDGGAVFISTNGGAATYLLDAAFSTNGYVGDTTANAPNDAWPGGEDVFYGKSAGYDTPALIQSIADLGPLNAGDTVSVEFRGGWDGAYNEAGTDWEVGTVKLTDAGTNDILDADFTANGASGFTVTNIGAVTAPWTYLKAVSRFEINADALTADRYAPDVAGSVIDLNDARLDVALLSGTLDAADSFALFDLSGGTTLTGAVERIDLPLGSWDVSTLEVDGTITYLGPPTETVYSGATGNWNIDT